MSKHFPVLRIAEEVFPDAWPPLLSNYEPVECTALFIPLSGKLDLASLPVAFLAARKVLGDLLVSHVSLLFTISTKLIYYLTRFNKPGNFQKLLSLINSFESDYFFFLSAQMSIH